MPNGLLLHNSQQSELAKGMDTELTNPWKSTNPRTCCSVEWENAMRHSGDVPGQRMVRMTMSRVELLPLP